MTYNTIPAEVIIRKVMRDLKPRGDNWVSDAVEWIGEALELIGCGAQITTEVELLNVANYTAKLPSFLMQINALKVNSQDVTSTDITTYNVPLSYDGSIFPRGLHCENCVNEYADTDYRYIVKGSAIKLNYETGKVCISYDKFETDDKGWPMVPDDASFKQAIYWYIFLKMMEGGMTHRHISYNKAEERWLHYAGQAKDNHNMPDIPQAENFMNQWVRLIPQMHQYDTGYRYLQSGEELDRDYISDRLWGPKDPLSDVINDTTEL